MSRRHVLNGPRAYRLVLRLAGTVPGSVSRWCARRVAEWDYLRSRAHRDAVGANLAPLFDDPVERRAAVLRLFRNYAEALADCASFFGRKDALAAVGAAFEEGGGYDHLKEALELGKGVVLLTAHVGPWELGGIYLRSRGLSLSVLTLEDPDPGVHEERIRLRSALGIRTVTVAKEPWDALMVAKALRRNEVAAMVADRYKGPSPVRVELFGRPALFAPGPALYARLTDAAVVPAFVVRGGAGRYRGIVLPALGLECTEDREADVCRNTQRLARVVEEVIRAYPDQWYNFERVWADSIV